MAFKQEDHLANYLEANRLIKKPEIQRLLGISRSTLGRWIKAGKFPAPKLTQNGSQRWLFEDVHKWLGH
ncbi:helix-turn-helix domain-containing protein [Shewanella sp. 4t3-1-2LB]|uniref:helix-turn-helix transcriptional regulator n=1 Tax=Shewanella sp. 4t3-1-2LB TaxID=2817682 RepID=UPI001A98AC91|nr:helix-turn-helix domain-containing protein [Shewanella sp. 4t3-1-2LB]MBO1271962.1 helix-turn-helix domain-containing protein [Shewanella sp. 4t3-1-2LB]